jgi:hypothetical protein
LVVVLSATKCDIIEQVLSVAKEQGIDTNAAAVMMADAASLLPHPITGHRCVCALFFELLGCDGNDA